MRSVEIDFQ